VDDTLGWVQYRRGNSSLAIGSFEAAARARPENATYQYHLGLAYKEMGDAAKARASFEKALALSASFDGSDDARQQLAGLEP
jgi:Flp pilus assembly protein TadD